MSSFIVIEGLDGSGKTELSKRLVAHFKNNLGHASVLHTYEPHNDYCAGVFIRQALRREIVVSDRTLLFAYAANREDHLQREILPFLQQPEHLVICDRYRMSSLVYQSTAEISMDEIMSVNRQALKPDLTLFLDVSPETARQRRQIRGGMVELFDAKSEMMRAKYEKAITFLQMSGERIERIDANVGIDQVLQQAIDIIAISSINNGN